MNGLTKAERTAAAARAKGVADAKRGIAATTGNCAVCGWRAPEIAGHNGCLHGHHIIPVSDGGDPAARNVIILCPNHHAVAHAIGARLYHDRQSKSYDSLLRVRLIRWLRRLDAASGSLRLAPQCVRSESNAQPTG